MLLFTLTAHAGAPPPADAIAEAMQLYAQALPMAINSPQRARHLRQSEAILKQVIREHPSSLDAHRKLLGVYLLQQDYGNAIPTMQRAITLSPEDPKLFIGLAFLYEHSGALEYARAMLAQALELDPQNSLAREYHRAIGEKIQLRDMALERGHGAGAPAAGH
ncbi:MAG: hypothetical protein B0D88_04880 [Candidatus Sedimenticola endophacoides]|nr:MAG: hypothetical protein B0D88_04880 [Candidatus Sedimenticola endophacoides]OQX43639.1 MAG: hypothetical protein B0D83_01025 [Candidatus Sedimenticola endophacoides]OQX48951.1 MAG: hypothetical protein B0D87_03005 [Candidatus Sedimenticola endophacoides]